MGEKAKEISEKDKLKEEHKRAAKKAEVKKDQLFKLFATVCKKDVDVALEKRATEKKERSAAFKTREKEAKMLAANIAKRKKKEGVDRVKAIKAAKKELQVLEKKVAESKEKDVDLYEWKVSKMQKDVAKAKKEMEEAEANGAEEEKKKEEEEKKEKGGAR